MVDVMNLGATLKSLREGYGFSIEDVTRLCGLPRERVSLIEKGEPPTVRELACLGAALAVDPSALHGGKIRSPKKTVARFRAPLGAVELSGHDARLLALAAECGRIGAGLQRMLGVVPVLAGFREVRRVTARPVPWQQGYDLGSNARKRLASEEQPLASVQARMESAGVHVARVRFESPEVEAASVSEPGSMPLVLLNSRAGRVRQRLSRRAILSHELCHLLHDGGERDLTVVSRDRDDSPTEQRANGFAPSFLAPPEWVEVQATEPRQVARELAETWGLTFTGAVWHAKNLKLIDAETADELQRRPHPNVTVGGFEEDLPRTPPAKAGLEVEATALTSGLLSDLALGACGDGLISRGRAREILTLR